jgi:hypothetical protein
MTEALGQIALRIPGVIHMEDAVQGSDTQSIVTLKITVPKIP